MGDGGVDEKGSWIDGSRRDGVDGSQREMYPVGPDEYVVFYIRRGMNEWNQRVHIDERVGDTYLFFLLAETILVRLHTYHCTVITIRPPTLFLA